MQTEGKQKLLVVKGTTKAFGQNRVLKGVDIAVGAGGLDGLYHPCSPLGGEGFVKGV